MWLVQRFYEGGFECGSIEEPFFVTADRDLAQTTIDLLNDNLARAKKLYHEGRPNFPHDKSVKGQVSIEIIKEYQSKVAEYDAEIDKIVTEYDPNGGSVHVDEYQMVEIEVR